MKFDENLEYPFLVQFSKSESKEKTIVAFTCWGSGVIVMFPEADDEIGDSHPNWVMEQFTHLERGLPNTVGIEGYLDTCDIEEAMRLNVFIADRIYKETLDKGGE